MKNTDQVYEFKVKPIHEIFYSEESKYGVYSVTTKNKIPKSNKSGFVEGIFECTIAGNMQKLEIGMEYDFQGILEHNKKYNNWQYNPLRITAPRLNSSDKVRLFLESIITKRQTEILMSAYPNIINMIMNGEQVDLTKTKGIKEATFSKITEKVIENYVISDILIMLRPLGVSFATIKNIISDEPNPVLVKQKLIENPYVLTRVNGLGFKRVDALALKLNPELRVSEHRTISFIKYFLKEEGESHGHTWISLKQLTSEVKSTLYDCFDVFKELIRKEKEKSTFLYVNKNKVGLKKYYDTEVEIFDRLLRLKEAKCNLSNINVENAINKTEDEFGFTLTEEQRNAVRSIKNNNIVIVTGNAGTGKSITLRGIINALEQYDIGMCSLSAKACQRMKEVTDRDAMTIHRLLGWTPEGFAHSDKNKLPHDVIILDEASLVNASIFLSLLKAIKTGSKLIIVFDHAQLPPIGSGNVSADLLKGEFLKVNKFTKIHRQAEKSGILLDANKIRVGVNPLEKPEHFVTHGELKDMHYIFKNKREEINDLIVKSFIKSLKTSSLDETTIIVPRKRNCLNSAYELNQKIQDVLFPNQNNFIKRGDIKFKLGAKVIQNINDYSKNVVNGEIGYITSINSDKNFTIKFSDGKVVEYSRQDIKNIELAYAITTHKFQGSQSETIIIALDNTHWVLLDSTLLYTAITRASKRCLLIAEPQAFKTCIDNNKSKIRKTHLGEFVKNYNNIF